MIHVSARNIASHGMSAQEITTIIVIFVLNTRRCKQERVVLI